MERDTGSSPAAGPWREVEAVLTSASFLVGATVLVGGVVVGVARDEPRILLLGLIGYLVAGLLAPRRPWATGLLLGLVNAAAAVVLSLSEPITWGASLLVILSMPVGVVVTGLVGHLVIRWLRTGAR